MAKQKTKVIEEAPPNPKKPVEPEDLLLEACIEPEPVVHLVPLTSDDLKANRSLMPYISMDLFLRYGLSDENVKVAREMCKKLGFECPRKGNPKK